MKTASLQQISRGLVSGLLATATLSILMVSISNAMAIPELELPRLIAHASGAPQMLPLAWGLHFMLGVFGYGVAMAALDVHLPNTGDVAHGVILGFIGWLATTIVLMPMAGAGLFGLNYGPMAAAVPLVLHLVFGIVLGSLYGLTARSSIDGMPLRAPIPKRSEVGDLLVE